MTNPDFHALITKMADELDHCQQLLMDDRRQRHPLADRARAALAAAPEGEPSDQELRDLWSWSSGQDQGPWPTQYHCFARAVLARWGGPAAALADGPAVPEGGEVR